MTGHQLNLFTGPVFFLYKIITAIKLSAALKKAYPKYSFIPVYWMATEDHDFEEINHFNFKGKKIRWNREAGGGVGKYMEHQTLAEATRYLVNELFGDYGLVILDGDDADLKRLSLPYMKKEVFIPLI